MEYTRLGSTGLQVSRICLGMMSYGTPTWREWVLDVDASRPLVRSAVEAGITFFDTADSYSLGVGEEVTGTLLREFFPRREDYVLATKVFFPMSDRPGDRGLSRKHVMAGIDNSLRRLGTDHVDVYQLHVGGLPAEQALRMVDVLADLVREGKIRTWGWSTDDAASIRALADTPGFSVVQHGLSVLGYEDPAVLALCDEFDLASINRSPLAMGALTGKFTPSTTFADDDQRSRAGWHPAFAAGRPTADWLARLDAVRDVLTSDGRTLAQGALAWIWARSPRTVPIPGFKTVAQVEENAGAMAAGPLTGAQMAEIAGILDGAAVG